LIGYFEAKEGDPELRYAGKVGTGFSDRDLDELLERLRPLAREANPFSGRRGPRAANFVEPQLVAEIEFRELTAEGMVRHGSFKGLREDKPADQVEVERPEPPGAGTTVVPTGGSRKRAKVTIEGRELSLSNLDKVLYPRSGFTKGELIEWYARMGEVLLPHLRGRPLRMKRYPDGVEAKHFYEKRCLVEDLPTLVWAANLAAVELHASLSPATAMERPTAVVFDLDPGAPADVLDCAQVAIWIRGMFEQLGLNAYAKTSGSKGIQVYVPLNTKVTYAQAKPFAKAVAETLEAKFPERIVSRMAKSRRGGRVLIDWSQNDPHKTTVSVYSLRAKERPTVSTPLEWDELAEALAESEASLLVFDHEAVLQRVEEKGDLFAPLLGERQQLPD
jgi:bifunctional non-homologous end joining protein LigD